MIKRAITLLVHGMNQSGGASGTKEEEPTSTNDYHAMALPGRDANLRIAQWIPELNPIRWLIINGIWCITYAVPLFALCWRDKSHFYYNKVFYVTVNVASCVTWVAQSALSAYWFWSHLGLARGIEMSIALYFVVDAFFIVFQRNTSNLSTFDIVIDYGVSPFAYIWAIELGIKTYLDMAEAFKATTIEDEDRKVLTVVAQHSILSLTVS
jgi:hypothetical protein